MTNVKTAISLEKELFEEINSLTSEMNISRSRFFSLAAREFIDNQKKQAVLDQLNDVYKEAIDESESILYKRMKRKQYSLVKDQW